MNLIEYWLSAGLWLAGIGHFILLCASFQVPHRLNWKEDLQSLSRFNRKLMWVYGGFTVLTIVAFGVMTLGLHNEFLHRNPAAIVMAAFIAVYWTLRILVDFFYYESSDWPTGIQFALGHFLLNFLFIALAVTYWATVVWYFLK